MPGQLSNFRLELESYEMSPELREMIYYKNAQSLIPRMKNPEVAKL